jgi:hypothetical protein
VGEVGVADDVGDEGDDWMMNGIGGKLACTWGAFVFFINLFYSSAGRLETSGMNSWILHRRLKVREGEAMQGVLKCSTAWWGGAWS